MHMYVTEKSVMLCKTFISLLSAFSYLNKKLALCITLNRRKHFFL